MQHLTRLALAALIAVASVIGTNAQAEVIANGLIGYWAGDGNAKDSSSLQNHGIFYATESYVPGVRGQAFNLNFTQGFVSIPDIPAYSFGPDATIGLWVYGASQGVYVGQDNGAGLAEKYFVSIGYPTPGVFDFHINHPSGPPQYIGVPAVGLTNDWNHLAFVKDDEDFHFYVNGQLNGSVHVPGVVTPDPTANLQFGVLEPCCGYVGYLDEVTLYGRALSAEEVAELARISEPATAGAVLFGAMAMALRRRRSALQP